MITTTFCDRLPYRALRASMARGCSRCWRCLAGCASPRAPAPVEDRSRASRSAACRRPRRRQPGAGVGGRTPPDATPLPGAENAGKPGYYTVKPGDTLIRIGAGDGPELARHRALEQHRQPERDRGRPGAARACRPASMPAPSRRAAVRTDARRARGRSMRSRRRRGAAAAPAGARRRGRALRRRRSPPPQRPVRRRRHQQAHAATTTSTGPGRPAARWSPTSTKRATRAWRSPARPAIRCSRPPTAAWSMPAPACAATATWSSSSTTTPTSRPTRTTRRCW